MSVYNEKVMEHFRHPRNVGVMDDPSGVGEVGNISCGDIMRMYIKVDASERITDIKFQTFGCGAAVATSSIVTEMAIGKTVHEALAMTNKQVAESLGGLPPLKLHCSNLAADALHAAVKDYLARQEALGTEPFASGAV